MTTPGSPPDRPLKPRGLLRIDKGQAHANRIADREAKIVSYSQLQWLIRWQPTDETPIQ